MRYLPSRTCAWLLAATLVLAVFGVSSRASAEREHTVRSGQSLARIARRYRVSVADLAAANRLRRDAQLRPGQVLVVPEAGTIYVARGQTLSSIARDHDVTVRELARANRLRATSTLRLGQRLILPGTDSLREREAAERRWGRPRNPGVGTLYRVSNRERLRIRLVDSRGRARSAAIRRVGRLMRHRTTGAVVNPHPRLIRLLAQISNHFGGRQINVLSGYRPAGGYTRESSRHTNGHAIDIRIQGVPKTTLRDYARTLTNVGVGFYPRSTFVHIDVRNRSSYWVDYSRPGEAPQYQRPADTSAEGADDEPSGAEPEAAPEPETSPSPAAEP